MIPKTHFLPQAGCRVGPPDAARRHWPGLAAFLLPACLLASCLDRDTAVPPRENQALEETRSPEGRPAAAPDRSEAHPAAKPRPAVPLQSASNENDRSASANPLDAWSYAPDLAAFHAIWHDRFALSAMPDPDPDALVPYADAVEVDGVSWGIRPSDIRFVYSGPDGAPHLVGRAHPPAPGKDSRSPLPPEHWTAPAWESVQAMGRAQHAYDGLELRMVGPVVARASCLDCHDYTADSVVGGLVYTFSELPDD